ncbi:hypothetical protein POTOM_044351 [Populus tomentosa]|uniref:Uncharacterized protein n=1 Tax=Populus tomentosa TaxID=118781 RepID=A0A8X7YN75_POPTO|nr:hypothetical protein POTOM_044351 [Populus tomentosa]
MDTHRVSNHSLSCGIFPDADCGNGGIIIVYCVLEFLLPRFRMKDTSERELLINKVLRTLQRKCVKSWKVSAREVNDARCLEVRLDNERTPNIPQETVSRVFQLPSSNADCVNGGIIIVDCVLEFLLPRFRMKETSERELLINEVLRTLQRKCLKSWKVSVREVNEARCSEVRLDDERTPNIPQETVSRVFQLPSSNGVLEGNGSMTLNPTGNQVEETREPLGQKRPSVLDGHPSCVQSQPSMWHISYSRLREWWTDCVNSEIIIVYCVLEFLLPRFRMKETSERELLINKVLRTLQRKCLKSWKVSVREVNEARCSEVRLDDERTPNIPQETVSRLFYLLSSDGVLEGNGSMTLNPTGNQAEQTRDPL